MAAPLAIPPPRGALPLVTRLRSLKEMAPQHALSAYLYSFEMNRFLALSDFDAEAESDG